jgi:hypothetical protein
MDAPRIAPAPAAPANARRGGSTIPTGSRDRASICTPEASGVVAAGHKRAGRSHGHDRAAALAWLRRKRHPDLLELGWRGPRHQQGVVGMKGEFRVVGRIRASGADAQVEDPFDGAVEPGQPQGHLPLGPGEREPACRVAFGRVDAPHHPWDVAVELDPERRVEAVEHRQEQRTCHAAEDAGGDRPPDEAAHARAPRTSS